MACKDWNKLAQEWLAEWSAAEATRFDTQVSAQELAAMIDHTALKTETTPEMLDKLCAEAREYQFASVCVNSANVAHCAKVLEGSGVPVCAVVGFPLGATISAAKAFEAEQAIAAGATEIDMVINVGALKAGDYDLVQNDLAAVAKVCHDNDAALKVIFENCLLTDLEKVIAAMLCVEVGVDFVKTSTGFNSGGATIEDIALMRSVVGADFGVKAAGGIRTYENALAMVEAGASRIGASSGVKIVQGAG